MNGPYLGCPDYDSAKVNKVFRLIIENCNNLREVIVFNDIILDESVFEEFYEKFGPKIKYLRSLREVFDLSRFPNIEKIKCFLNHAINDSIIPTLKLANKLKQLEIEFNQGEEHMFQIGYSTICRNSHILV